jgi:hypothetical protein
MGLLASTVCAQSTYNQPSSSGTSAGNETTVNQPATGVQTPGVEAANQTQEFFHAKNFIETSVKDSQSQSLGEIKDIVFSPQNGQTFAAFNAGNGRYFLVPWQALTITSSGRGKEQVSLNASKQELESGPTIPRNQWQQLSNPSFVQSIYSHYNLQMPTPAMGGTGSRSLGGTSSGAGTSGSSQEKSGQESK